MHPRRALLGVLLLVVVASAATPPLARWWLGPQSPLRRVGIRAVEEWMPEIRVAAREAGLPDPYLLAGVVYAESRGRPDAVSSIGARGLCQLMPPTAREVGAELGIDADAATPAENLRMGAHYLAEQIARHDGSVALGLLAYRLGPSGVQRAARAAGGTEAWLDAIRSRRPSPWGYVEQVEEMRAVFRARAQDAEPSG